MIARGFRFKLCPTAEQDALFRQFAGVCRLVYNLALEQRATWGRRHRLGYVQQAAELTRLRAEFDWIRAVYVSCQQQALRDLDRAFVNFFAARALPNPAQERRQRHVSLSRTRGRNPPLERQMERGAPAEDWLGELDRGREAPGAARTLPPQAGVSAL